MSVDPYLERKIRAGFDHLDADGDGVLSENDHVVMGRRAAAALGYEPGSAAEKQMIDSYCRIWRDVHARNDLDGDGVVSRDEFTEATLSLSARQPGASGPSALTELANALFDIADVDGDGNIQPQEYYAFTQGHAPKLSRRDARLAFDHIDLDGDGLISRVELATALEEYWTSRDPQAAGNWFFGTPPEAH